VASEINEFVKRIAIRVKQVQDNTAKIVRKAALAIDQTLVLATPVNTGRARSNWLVSINVPNNDAISPYSAGVAGSTGSQNAQAAIAQGTQVIGSYKPGDTAIFITNNLPYISALNDGSSKQAPAHFIEQSIQTAVKAVNGAKLLEG
jgi:hypothetical protein